MVFFSNSKYANLHQSFLVAIENSESGRLQGRLYDAGGAEVTMFHSLIQVVTSINQILDDNRYPVPNMEQRTFKRSHEPKRPGAPKRTAEEKSGADRCRPIAAFEIRVCYRFHTSWQGRITRRETGETCLFESLLQMLCFIGETLGEGLDGDIRPAGFDRCEIAMDSSGGEGWEGSLYHPSLDGKIDFRGILPLAMLAEQMYCAASEIESPVQMGKIISSQMLGIYRQRGRTATFSVQVLFCGHHTIQGIVRWKEEKEKRSFRSFMELILLIEAAIFGGNQWHGISEEQTLEK